MGIVAKFYIQSESVQPDGSSSFHLGAVCRGEQNKQWASATPAGSAGFKDDVLADVWAGRKERGHAEVYLVLDPDSEGDWKLESCSFSYGGCAVKFVRDYHMRRGPGELSMTVNAAPATGALRQAFADGLIAGEAPKFRLAVVDAPGQYEWVDEPGS